MTRWIRFLFAIFVGIALGLVYGWFFRPGNTSNTPLDSLRIDYKTDYVLMVAEAFSLDHDSILAANRLELLGNEPPAVLVEESLEFAQKVGYKEPDIQRIQALLGELGIAAPDSGGLQP